MSESDSEMPDLDSPDAFEGGTEPASARGMILSRTALARALRKDVKTIDKAIRDGAPVLRRGVAATRTAHEIDLADFVEWMVKRAREAERKKTPIVSDGEEAFDEEKRRDKAAQADLRELQVAKLKGELVPFEEVHRHIDECSGLVRAAAHSLHTQVRELTPDQREDLIAAANAMLAHIHAFVPPEVEFTDDDFTFES